MTRTPCVEITDTTDALLKGTVHFLPTAEQAAALRPAAETSLAIEALGAAIRQHRQPSAAACADTPRTTRLSVREGGFGSTLSSLIKPYLWSLMQAKVPLSAQPLNQAGSRKKQYTLVPTTFAPLEKFRNRTTCATESLECFLQPLTNCSGPQRLRASAPSLGGRWNELTYHDDLVAEAVDRAAAAAAAARAAGRFATVALLLGALLQPSAPLRRTVCAARRAMGWPRRGAAAGAAGAAGAASGARGGRRPLLLGLHVRRGDACDPEALGRHNRTCSPLAAYMPALLAARAAYAAPSEPVYVYLATDDLSVLRDHRRVAGRELFTWLVRRNIEQLLMRGNFDGHADAMAVLVDLLLLAQCDVLIGKFSSNVDRLAFSLMALQPRGGRRAGGSATAGAATRAAPRAGWCSAAAAAAADAGAPGNASTWAAAPPLPWPSGDGPPRLCVPPFVSLDHPWCAEWFMSVPLATLGPQRYAGPAGDAAGRVVGGFQC